MTLPVPYTWADDVVITESLMNANVRDPLSWLMGPPTFVGWNTVSTTLLTVTYTPIPMNTEDKKVGFTHAANATQVYATEPGWYRWMATVHFTSTLGNTGGRAVYVRKNGSTTYEPGGAYHGHSDSASNPMAVGGITGFVYLNGTTDYVELVAYQSTTGSTATEVTNPALPGLTLIWQGRDA